MNFGIKLIESLRKALETENLNYQVDEGGGAFYGPKIDIKIKDALGQRMAVEYYSI
ncbi:MAG: hypothetical protein MZV64_46300 [Ignavibacteriales bacterium]|nr:hypothetical protein [Ignavibacteriales bacterium]